MLEFARIEAQIAEYDRYASGGRARAARAARSSDGDASANEVTKRLYA